MKTVFQSSNVAGPAGGEIGFTRTDLLAVAAVIALLLALQFSALSVGNSRTKITQCAGNLRQLSLAMLLYGNDNFQRLPTESQGNWLWDLDWGVGETLNRYGATQDIMYCPGTAPRFQPADNEQLYEYYAPGNIHVIGYAVTFPGAPSLAPTNANPFIEPHPIPSIGTILPPPLPAQRVLVADATLTSSPTNFTSILGGYKVPHLSAHLNGFIPAGGNLGMLDGHVEWRPFSQMQQRTVAGTPGAQPAFFW